MGLTEIKNIHEQDLAASTVVPISHLVSPCVFATQSGALGATIKFEGVPFVTQTNRRLNDCIQNIHQALRFLGEGFMLVETLHRRQSEVSLEGEFKSEFARQVNERYLARFKDKKIYCNDIYWTIILNPELTGLAGKGVGLFKKLSLACTSFISEESAAQLSELNQTRRLNKLNDVVNQFIVTLDTFGPHLLGKDDTVESGKSELLSFLSLIPNAGSRFDYRLPSSVPALSSSVKDVPSQQDAYPEGHIGQYLCRSRIHMGEAIQIDTDTEERERFASLVSIRQYPQVTGSLMFDEFMNKEYEFISTHTIAPIGTTSALSRVKKQRNKLINAEDLALSQQEQLDELEDGLASETEFVGVHHHTMMVIADSLDSLKEHERDLIKTYAMLGIVACKESWAMGLEASFWSQIPGNQHLIARCAEITASNFADFCSLHNYELGFKDQNHLGGAMSIVETPSKTPVYVNFHAKSNKTDPAPGHGLIVGSNGSGKNVLAEHFDNQLGRYNNRTFFIDRNQASRIYVLASGNSDYFVIAPGSNDALSLNPFQLEDTPKNRTFLKTWMQHLVMRPGETKVPAKVSNMMSECVNYAFENLDKAHRKLSNVVSLLPVDFERWDELNAWLEVGKDGRKGEVSWLFDNDNDTMSLDLDKVGFDVTYLMDEASREVSTPVYMYMLHRMREAIESQTGVNQRLTTIVMDEFWQILMSLYWVELLKTWLPTIRKQNAHFIFMTQSVSTVLNSPVRDQILNNLATMILFPEPDAKKEHYIDGLDLTPSEFEIIKNNRPDSRLFLYQERRNKNSILCRLDLSDMPDVIRVYSANQASNRELDKLIAQKGGSCPSLWLGEFMSKGAA